MKKSINNTAANLASLIANKKVTMKQVKFTGTGTIARFIVTAAKNDNVNHKIDLANITPENLQARIDAPSPKQARAAKQKEAKIKAAQRKRERAAAKKVRDAAKREKARAKKAAAKNKKSAVKVSRVARKGSTVGKTTVNLTRNVSVKSPARKPVRRMARTVAPMM